MKKIWLSAAFLLLFSKSRACADYYPDGDYFNLFTQSIIKDKTYLPFLLVYGQQFYEGGDRRIIPNENIHAWRAYFQNKLSYPETEFLVNHMPMNDLNAYKRGGSSNAILNKVGAYKQNSEAIDYLIEAKYLEPFMRINYVESEDSFYRDSDDNSKNATNLDYEKTVSALTNLYNAAKNPEIKQRYGYQLVRFHHYTRNYEDAISAFNSMVKPHGQKSSAYFYALDQMAGAQRGLKMNDEANWNFFQVFMKAPSRKESAFVSMKITDSASFNNILKKASTPEEKNMAYFLLSYSEYTNPLPNMEKMYEIDPNSEILKVLAARAINQLERSYLPQYLRSDDQQEKLDKLMGRTEPKEEAKPEERSFWDKVVSFFKNLFGKKENSTVEGTEDQSEGKLADHPDRIPIFQKQKFLFDDEKSVDFLNDFADFTEKTRKKSNDEFWSIADAYLKFLRKEQDESNEILASLNTSNPEYQQEIKRLQMLNEITERPKIDAAFENELIQKYPQLFADKKTSDTIENQWNATPTTADFVSDVLANRYFLQHEDGKSFLMSNRLSDLQYFPNVELAKSIEQFLDKPQKTALEQKIMQNVDMTTPKEFLKIIYGDQEVRNGNFAKAAEHYSKAVNAGAIPRFEYIYGEDKYYRKPVQFSGDVYDGFNNISSLIFGHNVWESFSSAKEQSMQAEPFTAAFGFIKPKMNKLEFAQALVHLQQDGSAEANQLIGNALYNTTSLGYFREVLMMDIDNSPWAKNDIFRNSPPQFQYYYKYYSQDPAIAPDNYDVAIGYYQKALQKTADQEQKSRILFQMASAEQGKYYQWESKQENNIPYDDPNWEAKNASFQKELDGKKNSGYRKYFAQLKSGYSNTSTAKNLMGSCAYFDYFMGK